MHPHSLIWELQFLLIYQWTLFYRIVDSVAVRSDCMHMQGDLELYCPYTSEGHISHSVNIWSLQRLYLKVWWCFISEHPFTSEHHKLEILYTFKHFRNITILTDFQEFLTVSSILLTMISRTVVFYLFACYVWHL